eukprot:1209002-Rhodomonas_salina.4
MQPDALCVLSTTINAEELIDVINAIFTTIDRLATAVGEVSLPPLLQLTLALLALKLLTPLPTCTFSSQQE